MELKDRKKQILKIIVDHYIDTGIPIGSKAVVQTMQDKLSTATIRNEMAALEEMGFLMQPHISAGRVPSDLAYRFYVDALMEMQPLNRQEISSLKNVFDHQVKDVKQVVGDTVKVLSDITNCVALATLPQSQELKIKNVKLVPITRDKALVVIVTDRGVVGDRFVRFPEHMSEMELGAIAHLMTQRMRDVTDIGSLKSDEFYRDIDQHKQLVHDVLDVFAESVQAKDGEIILKGATNIFDFPEYQDVDKAKLLIRTLEDQHSLAGILEGGEHGLSIIIGAENELEPIAGCSLIKFQYDIPDIGKGSFGIVGPKRMNYGKMLKILQTLGDHIRFYDLE